MRLKLTSLLIFVALMTFGQKHVQQGDQLYGQLAFSAALEQYLKADQTQPEVMFKIAECYRMMQDNPSALNWYEKVSSLKTKDPLILRRYGQALMLAGKYKEAAEVFEQSLAISPEDFMAKKGLESAQKAAVLNTFPKLFDLSPLPFNTPNLEYAAFPYEDGLLFSSDRSFPGQRPEDYSWTGEPFTEVYYWAGDAEGTVRRMDGSLSSVYNDGPLCLNRDETKLFLTRNYTKAGNDGILHTEIVACAWDRAKNRWKEAESLPFNDPSFSNAHPSLSADGKTLVYSSTRPDGFGGADLWQVKWDSKKKEWSAPENLGAEINTPGDEKFPHWTEQGIFFSSNGHGGLGGLDVFLAKNEDEEFHLWHLGRGLNSSADDFALAMENETQGFVSSARDQGKGKDDVYAATLVGAFLEIEVIDFHTGLPVKDAQVAVNLGGQKWMIEADARGHRHFPVSLNQWYEVGAKSDGYFPSTESLKTDDWKAGETHRLTIALKGDYPQFVEGLVVEAQSGLPLEGVQVRVGNNNPDFEDSLMVDKGLFLYGVASDMNYNFTASKEGYGAETIEVSTDTLTAGDTIRVLVQLGGGDVVTKIGFENIYFDYDKATLRKESKEELDKMLKILALNPALKVELGAHTDSRASEAYNLGLSQRRAQAVMDYLIEHGVEKDRLMPKGYGESQLVNACSDGVNCSEEEHQKNRRVEFKLIQ